MVDPPEGYPVSSYCTTCGNDFAGDWLFDRHRIGKHDYDYKENNPALADGRRCMNEQEMLNAGMRIMTVNEMLASNRHKRRAEFNVNLWFDESETRRARETFAEVRE